MRRTIGSVVREAPRASCTNAAWLKDKLSKPVEGPMHKQTPKSSRTCNLRESYLELMRLRRLVESAEKRRARRKALASYPAPSIAHDGDTHSSLLAKVEQEEIG